MLIVSPYWKDGQLSDILPTKIKQFLIKSYNHFKYTQYFFCTIVTFEFMTSFQESFDNLLNLTVNILFAI